MWWWPILWYYSTSLLTEEQQYIFRFGYFPPEIRIRQKIDLFQLIINFCPKLVVSSATLLSLQLYPSLSIQAYKQTAHSQ
jgi:hypothetical protein